MNTLKYKGYIGSVNYSDEDMIFFGKVEGITGLVNYEADNVKDLNIEFQQAVNDYIVFCRENGIPVHKSYSGTLNVRLTPELHARAAQRSAELGISINQFIKQALKNAMM